jgi:uncharacterized ParB-like nuclease family protein
MKCFCGKEAVYRVVINSDTWKSEPHYYKFRDCPRCEECTERAKNSYENVEVYSLEEDK